jgi:peptidoglycan/LPS O-acetylase OafA/YrhL
MLLMFPQHIFRIPFLSDFGFFAVNFFFLISGFIIYEVISRDKNFQPLPFLVKRFFRLWPPYAFATVIYVALFLIVENKPASVELITVQRFIQTLTFWPLQITPVLPPGWSLEHEVIFYIFAAIFAGGFGAGGLVVFLFLNSLAAISIYMLEIKGVVPRFWDYHLIDMMNAYFFLGVLASRYKEKLRIFGYELPILIGAALFGGGDICSRANGTPNELSGAVLDRWSRQLLHHCWSR